MRELNRNPEIRVKTTVKLQGRTFANRGGNGQLTPQQETLHKALGWAMEHAVATGNPKWKAAVVDLAEPSLKIAIECDGASHHTKKQKNRDRKKAQMLEALGWVVLRFWNSRVDNELDQVLQEIRAIEKSRSSQ